MCARACVREACIQIIRKCIISKPINKIVILQCIIPLLPFICLTCAIKLFCKTKLHNTLREHGYFK